jgi:hypothetical protein
MARKMASSFGHGWARYEGETLEDILVKMREFNLPPVFDAGVTPYLYEKNGAQYIGHVTENGRLDWTVNESGVLVCNVRRPAGIAIVIAVKEIPDQPPEITIRRTALGVEYRHLLAVAQVIKAAAGEQYVEEEMNKFLGDKNYANWRDRVKKEYPSYSEANFFQQEVAA